MPMFTNNVKVAAVSIDKGLVALGVAISFEAAYNLMNDEYDLQGSREEYVAWVADEREFEEEHGPHDTDPYHDTVVCDGEDNTLECPM